MHFSKDMIDKAKTASSAEELMQMAAREGIELTAEEASQYFSLLRPSVALSDDELDIVAGGKGDAACPASKFNVGQRVKFWMGGPFETGLIVSREYSEDMCAWYYIIKPDGSANMQYDLSLEDSVYKTEVL